MWYWTGTRTVMTLSAVAVMTGGLAPLVQAGDPAAAAAPAAVTAVPTPEDLKALAAGNNRLALDLYAKLRAKEKGNFCFSPFSLRTALAMAYAGARGDTAAQMRQALYYGPDDAKLHAACAASIRALNTGGEKDCEVAVANSLWGEQTRPFLPPFLELIRTSYGGGFERVDFLGDAEAARQQINGWVEGRTKAKIKDLIPPRGVDWDTGIVLVNALYFKGRWAEPFDPRHTVPLPFHLADGTTTVTAPLMAGAVTCPYAEVPLVAPAGGAAGADQGRMQVLELPYQGDALAMVVLLPRADTRLADLEAELSADKLAQAFGALQRTWVAVMLPRFTLTWGTRDLGPQGLAVLPDLGMPQPFNRKTADFSGMDGRRPPDAANWLYLAAVYHQTFVAVSEAGTEAAAATAVEAKIGGVPPEFRADRPFLFLIRERATGNILFLGRVLNPVAP